jgi:YD repeat-containing protein
MEYDTRGRLLQLTSPDGTVSFIYDGNKGTLNSIIASDNGTLEYGYDGSLPTSTAWGKSVNGTVAIAYNNDLAVSSQTVNGNDTVELSYNDDGQLTGIGSLSINYDAATGMFTGSTIGTVTDAVVSRNEFGEVTDYRATFSGSPIFGTQYTYDRSGRIITKTETVAGQTQSYRYGYDAAGQLTDVWQGGVLTSHYAYDSNGNWLGGIYDTQGKYLRLLLLRENSWFFLRR